MRVLHVIPALGYGGAERVLVSLACGQQRAGYDVSVLTQTARASERDMLLREDVRVIELGGTSRSGLMVRSASWLGRSRGEWATFDVVHEHLPYGSLFGALARLFDAVNETSGPAFVQTDHAAGMSIPRRTRLIYGATCWHTNALVSVMRSASTTVRTPKWTLRTAIPNGIEPLPIRTSWQVGGPLRLGSLGLLRPDRRPERYLELVRELSRLGEVSFTFGGDGPLRSELERSAQAMGVSEIVQFAGLIDDKERFLSGLDVHVSLAVGGDVGLSTLEAASTATPSFTQQISPGMSWSHNAIPTRENAYDLANVIWELAASSEDRQALGRSQAAYVRRERSLDRMIKAYEDVYHTCLRGRPSR